MDKRARKVRCVLLRYFRLVEYTDEKVRMINQPVKTAQIPGAGKIK